MYQCAYFGEAASIASSLSTTLPGSGPLFGSSSGDIQCIDIVASSTEKRAKCRPTVCFLGRGNYSSVPVYLHTFQRLTAHAEIQSYSAREITLLQAVSRGWIGNPSNSAELETILSFDRGKIVLFKYTDCLEDRAFLVRTVDDML